MIRARLGELTCCFRNSRVNCERERIRQWGALRRAFDFQVAHDQAGLAAVAQIDEGIGHEKTDSIEHVGIVFASGL